MTELEAIDLMLNRYERLPADERESIEAMSETEHGLDRIILLSVAAASLSGCLAKCETASDVGREAYHFISHLLGSVFDVNEWLTEAARIEDMLRAWGQAIDEQNNH